MSRIVRSKELTIGDAAKFSPKIQSKLPQTFRNIIPARIETKSFFLNESDHDLKRDPSQENVNSSQIAGHIQGRSSIRKATSSMRQKLNSNPFLGQLVNVEASRPKTAGCDQPTLQPIVRAIPIFRTQPTKSRIELIGDLYGGSVLSNSNLTPLNDSGYDMKASQKQKLRSSLTDFYGTSPEHQKFKTTYFGLSPAKRFFSKTEAVSLKKPLSLSFRGDSKKKIIPTVNSMNYRLTTKYQPIPQRNHSQLSVNQSNEPRRFNISMPENNLIATIPDRDQILFEVPYRGAALQQSISPTKNRSGKSLDEEFERLYSLEFPSTKISTRFPPEYFKKRLLMMQGPKKYPGMIHLGLTKTFRKVIRMQNSKY